jgi:hypothetical protein
MEKGSKLRMWKMPLAVQATLTSCLSWSLPGRLIGLEAAIHAEGP